MEQLGGITRGNVEKAASRCGLVAVGRECYCGWVGAGIDIVTGGVRLLNAAGRLWLVAQCLQRGARRRLLILGQSMIIHPTDLRSALKGQLYNLRL